MSNKFPSRDSLSAMSVARLKLLDVFDGEDEALLQEILSSKLALLPLQDVAINRGTDNTDFKSGEEEAAFQAKIDARIAKRRPKKVEVQEEEEQAKEVKIKKIK